MKTAAPFLLLATLLACPIMASAAQGEGAILRCDPAIVIEKIDGTDSDVTVGHGPTFHDCAVPLAPGTHQLEVCYDASTQSFTGGLLAKCEQSRVISVDALAGHRYRVKFKPASDWRAWVEDVTEAEAGLSFEEPSKKPKPAGSKKDLETILVMRATPTYAWLNFNKGVVFGKWFLARGLNSIRSKGQSTKGVPEGFHILRVTAGDTVALNGGRMMIGSMFVAKNITACGNYPLHVFEDLPGGKVLYLGHVEYTDAPGGYTERFIDDLAEARAWLDAHEPELAGRLESTPYRVLNTPYICYGFPGDMPGPPVIPAGASAGSK